MMDFIRGTVSGDIQDVPGIGPAAAKRLASGEGDDKVTNTYQLIGKVGIRKRRGERGGNVASFFLFPKRQRI